MAKEHIEQVQSTETGEKTFTQEEVNAIIGKRLAEQKTASGKELADKEAELNRREMGIRAKELLSEKGLPLEFVEVLKYDDEESLEKAINLLENTRAEILKEKKPKHKVLENKLPMGCGEDSNADQIRDIFIKQKG